MAVLTQKELWTRIQRPNDPLVVTPLLADAQIEASSIDVRLGQQFIILQRPATTNIDPTRVEELTDRLFKTQQRIRVSLREPFIIHPGQLVLAATLEYVSMPKDLAATVEGRSSWGRLGLIIATACSIAPGFKGCITLELVNDGEVPLVLYPGIRIAQIVFHSTEKEADYREPGNEDGSVVSKYDCPTGPEFSRIHLDPEMEFWGKHP